MNDLAAPTAGQALDVALPRALRTPHRTLWVLRRLIKWIRVIHVYSRSAADAGYRAAAEDDVRGLLADHRARAGLVRLGQRWPELAAFLAVHGVQPS